LKSKDDYIIVKAGELNLMNCPNYCDFVNVN